MLMYMLEVRSMVRTQVYLTEAQERGLKQLAASTGRRQSALLREAIEGYLAEQKPRDWKEALEVVCGIWADRDDLDPLQAALRREVEERLERRDPKRRHR
jgi:predicted DNA-binding protein